MYWFLPSLVIIISLSEFLVDSGYYVEALSLQKFASRRSAIKTASKWFVIPSSVAALSKEQPALAQIINTEIDSKSSVLNPIFDVYQVIPDASEKLSPSIKSINVRNVLIIHVFTYICFGLLYFTRN